MKKDYSDLHFENIIDTINRSVSNRISFIGFLITINVALVYALLFKDIDLIANLNCVEIKYIILYFQLFINISFSIIHIREYKLTVAHQTVLEENFSNDEIKAYLKKVIQIDARNKGLHEIVVRILVSVFIMFPIVILTTSNILTTELYKWAIYSITFLCFCFGLQYKIVSIISSILINKYDVCKKRRIAKKYWKDAKNSKKK